MLAKRELNLSPLTLALAEDLRSGRLRQVLAHHRLADSGIYALMPQRRLVPLRVRAFVDFLAAKFGETPPWERASPAGRRGSTVG